MIPASLIKETMASEIRAKSITSKVTISAKAINFKLLLETVNIFTIRDRLYQDRYRV